jgi:L,D-peptidoglycan transpeptidase YkuD (ErfK/YbiS/YcfS/YnhG family)
MSIFGDQVHFSLYSLNRNHTKARLKLKGSVLSFPCAIGKNGQAILKKEGDNKTPIGTWKPIKLYYRADRIKRPLTSLPIAVIKSDDGWCDEPFDPNYNRHVKLPHKTSYETLWRDDHIYDLVLVLNHNQRPRIHGLGSAIFMHLARPGYQPTEGCIALSKKHFECILKTISASTKITI